MKLKSIILLMLMFSIAHIAFGSHYIILGERGELLLYNDDNTSVFKNIEVPVSKDMIQDSFFNIEKKILYVTIARGDMYEVNPLDANPVYKKVDTDGEHVAAILANQNTGCPIILKYRYQNNKNMSKLYEKSNETWNEFNKNGKDKIIYSHTSLSKTFISEGILTTVMLLKKYPFIRQCIHEYNDTDKWVMEGRSSNIVSYGLVVAKSTKVGDPFKDRYVLINEKQNTCYFAKFDEAVFSFVYDDIVIFQGNTDIKGAKNAGILHYSGNYYCLSKKICG